MQPRPGGGSSQLSGDRTNLEVRPIYAAGRGRAAAAPVSPVSAERCQRSGGCRCVTGVSRAVSARGAVRLRRWRWSLGRTGPDRVVSLGRLTAANPIAFPETNSGTISPPDYEFIQQSTVLHSTARRRRGAVDVQHSTAVFDNCFSVRCGDEHIKTTF